MLFLKQGSRSVFLVFPTPLVKLTRSSGGVLNRYFQSPAGSIKISTHDSAI